MKKLPVYNVVVNPECELDYISLVANPAIMEMGLAFNEHSESLKFAQVEDKQIIVGPAMIPDVPLYRNIDGKEFYVVFSADAIEKLAEKFNRAAKETKINVDHSLEVPSAFIKSLWIIEDKAHDKSNMYHFDLPVGTLMVEVKVEDKEFWNKEVKGNAKFGFSVEGFFGLVNSGLEFNNNNEVKIENEMELTPEEIKMIEDLRAKAKEVKVEEEVKVEAAEVVVEEEVKTPEANTEVVVEKEAIVSEDAVMEIVQPHLDKILSALAEIKSMMDNKEVVVEEKVESAFNKVDNQLSFIAQYRAKYND